MKPLQADNQTGWNALIEGCRRSNSAAQCEIYRRCWSAIFPAVLRIVRDHQEAEDLMQESMIRGFQRLHELKVPESYPAWQKQISIRYALNSLRKKKNGVVLNIDHAEIVDENEIPLLENISEDKIRNSVNNLPEGYRLVITLHLLEEMTHEDIAGALGISASTSRSQYSRAIKRLQTLLLKEHEQKV